MLCCLSKKSMNTTMEDLEETFKGIGWDEAIPFQPDIKVGKVIKVYDGDSITVAAKPYEKYPIYRFSVRLSGIDTPELRTKHENEKKHAIIARDALSQKILNKIVDDFVSLKELLEESDYLSNLIKSPAVSKSDKQNSILKFLNKKDLN